MFLQLKNLNRIDNNIVTLTFIYDYANGDFLKLYDRIKSMNW